MPGQTTQVRRGARDLEKLDSTRSPLSTHSLSSVSIHDILGHVRRYSHSIFGRPHLKWPRNVLHLKSKWVAKLAN